jgi:1,4-dihydroxy-2-naphthoate octaprenyltransferase
MTAQDWFFAVRPKTLPASMIPVVLGSASAWYHEGCVWWVAVCALVCSMLIQIITNFVNQVYDFRKGADTDARVGPMNPVATGMISDRYMLRVAVVLTTITFCLGLLLVWRGGLPIFLIGVVSLVCAYLYTAGPAPLAYKGLGDVFVFIFFGVVAVCGTHYAHTLTLSVDVLLLSCAPGALSCNILTVNNIRDSATDVLVGKRTLAVRFGNQFALHMYGAMMVVAFAVPFGMVLCGLHPVVCMVCGLAIPAWHLYHDVQIHTGTALNPVLAGTGKLLAQYGIVMTVLMMIAWWMK